MSNFDLSKLTVIRYLFKIYIFSKKKCLYKSSFPSADDSEDYYLQFLYNTLLKTKAV